MVSRVAGAAERRRRRQKGMKNLFPPLLPLSYRGHLSYLLALHLFLFLLLLLFFFCERGPRVGRGSSPQPTLRLLRHCPRISDIWTVRVGPPSSTAQHSTATAPAPATVPTWQIQTAICRATFVQQRESLPPSPDHRCFPVSAPPRSLCQERTSKSSTKS